VTEPSQRPVPTDAADVPLPESHALIAKLERSVGLTDEDRGTLAGVMSQRRWVSSQVDLIREGDRPESVFLVTRGFACRYKILVDGQRHILGLLVPGDTCDLHVAILNRMDHSIAALTACEIVEIPRSTIVDLTSNHPRIAQALCWATLVEQGILREWLTNLGQRGADQRMAHLFCELLLRLQVVGLAGETGCFLPLTQVHLADILGFSIVHANRTLQHLRFLGLVDLKHRHLKVPNLARLRNFCSFNPEYLHLSRRA
jgi:CRP-like cAMP-binding protein